MKLDKRDGSSNFRTYCARHTTHRLGEIPVDSFQLPSGEYRLNPTEVADTIAQVPDSISQFLNGYQQALSDFGITELLSHLSDYEDANFNAAWMNLEEQELESLAAIFIQQLTANLKGKLIASYLNAIRHDNADVFNDPINLEFPQSVSLPLDFPNGVQTPRFLYGDQVHIVPEGGNTEWGVVIGRFYNYAPHRCCWMWRYILWLDKASLSTAWVVASTVWEEDLEPHTKEEER